MTIRLAPILLLLASPAFGQQMAQPMPVKPDPRVAAMAKCFQDAPWSGKRHDDYVAACTKDIKR